MAASGAELDSWITLFEEQRKHITRDSITPDKTSIIRPPLFRWPPLFGKLLLRLQHLNILGIVFAILAPGDEASAPLMVGYWPDNPCVSESVCMCMLLRECACSGEASGIPGPLPAISSGQSPCAGGDLKSKQDTDTHTHAYACTHTP